LRKTSALTTQTALDQLQGKIPSLMMLEKIRAIDFANKWAINFAINLPDFALTPESTI
jgi:hypothetical protein